MRLEFLVHPAARVGHDEHHVRARIDAHPLSCMCLVHVHGGGLEGQGASLGHGVPRVDDKIQDDLLELPGVGSHVTRVFGLKDFQLDALSDQTPKEAFHRAYDPIQVEHLRLEHLFPAEGEELAGQGGCLLHRFLDLRHLKARGICLRDVHQQQVRIGCNGSQQIVEIVRDPPCESPNRVHFL